MARDLLNEYDVFSTVGYISRHRFSVVVLQFPDELLKASVAVTGALRKELAKISTADWQGNNVKLFVMADTTYGSCCADEVAAAHVNADCIIHYGHACHSSTSRLPVFHVYGKAALDVEHCATSLWSTLSGSKQPLLVLFGLEYAHAMTNLEENITQRVASFGGECAGIHFGEAVHRETKPLNRKYPESCQGKVCKDVDESSTSGSSEIERGESAAARMDNGKQYHTLGGLRWSLRDTQDMEKFRIFWIGNEGSALTNIMLTYNSCSILRYDPASKVLQTDVASQSRVLKRRYYLVERAKDANIVGIVVGTLGVAGYENAIQNLRKMISAAHKKAYVLLMGKPNPAKLANFPECEVFVQVACAQTALLDSKEYLAPLITPFEAQLAFIRGSQWSGAYRLDFQGLLDETTRKEAPSEDEPRFSFLKGQYVEGGSSGQTGNDDAPSRALVLSKAAEHALQLSPNVDSKSLGLIKSSAEYLAVRSYQGLESHTSSSNSDSPTGIVLGRKGRAAGYTDEAAS